MFSPVTKATFRTFLCVAAFASFADAQVVERGRTLADLIQSHPCNSGLENRIARVTDCDAADDVGDGAGAFNCWVSCDGSAPWVTQAIGAGGGGAGVSGLDTADGGTALSDNSIVRGDGTTGIQGSAVTIADTTGNLQWEGTTADAFEGNFTFADPTADWTWAWGAAGDLVGAGSLSIDNLKIDGNTLSSTDTNGNINLTPNGTGLVVFPAGSAAAPSISFGDAGYGFYRTSANKINIGIAGVEFVQIDSNALYLGRTSAWSLYGMGRTVIGGFTKPVITSTAGSGAPATIDTALYLGGIFTNQGTTVLNYWTLPTAAAGYPVTHCVQDADGIRIVANTGDTIRVIDKVTASAGYIESTTIGSCWTGITLNATEWFTTSITGIWSDGTFTYDDTSLTTP